MTAVIVYVLWKGFVSSRMFSIFKKKVLEKQHTMFQSNWCGNHSNLFLGDRGKYVILQLAFYMTKNQFIYFMELPTTSTFCENLNILSYLI